MNLGKSKRRLQTMIFKSKAVMKDNNKKSIFKIMKELTIIALKERCIPTHYFSYFLYRNGVKNYLGYLTGREARKVHRWAHSPCTLQVLDNKLLFHEHFSKLGLAVPKRLAYNFKHLWFIDKESGLTKVEVNSAEELRTIMQDCFWDANRESVFAKPIGLSGGRGAIRISREIFTTPLSENAIKLFSHMINGCFIVQEYLFQHPEMSRLNASSLNTIRVATFNPLKSSPEIISALLRMGRYGQVVDNTMAGGIWVWVNLESGKPYGNAITPLEHGGLIFSRHPDSKVEFKDFSIPYFHEVKEMACKAASSISEKLVGWDIGISDKGPVLIEGNGYFELHGIYKQNPVFKKAMAEAGIKMSD